MQLLCCMQVLPLCIDIYEKSMVVDVLRFGQKDELEMAIVSWINFYIFVAIFAYPTVKDELHSIEKVRRKPYI